MQIWFGGNLSVKRTLLFTASILILGCKANILQNFANTKTDDARYEQALQSLNKADYAGALGSIAAMGSDFQASRKVINLRASAYGGQCGINFLSFVQDFTDIGTTHLFPFLLSEFTAATSARLDACVNAQNLIESIGDITYRTSDENLFLALIGMAKMGNILDYYADQNADGVADSSVDVCQDTRTSRPTSPVSGNFYDADLREFGTGLTLAIANLNAVAALTSLGSGTLATLTHFCTQLPSNFCGKTDPTAFTTTDMAGIQSLIKEGSVVGLGIGACSGQDITTCHCP